MISEQRWRKLKKRVQKKYYYCYGEYYLLHEIKKIYPYIFKDKKCKLMQVNAS